MTKASKAKTTADDVEKIKALNDNHRQSAIYIAITDGAALATVGGIVSQALDKPEIVGFFVPAVQWFMTSIWLALLAIYFSNGIVATVVNHGKDHTFGSWGAVRFGLWVIRGHLFLAAGCSIWGMAIAYNALERVSWMLPTAQ